MFEFIRTHIWIIPACLSPLALLLLVILLGRRKRRKNEEDMIQRKRRDEALSEALRNPLVSPARNSGENAMEITWDEKAVSREKGKSALMAELVELSGYSKRKYIFRVDEPIRIGSAPENRLSLPREGVAKVHCEIFMKGREACVRSAPKAKTLLKRGGTSALVGTEGVYLKNGDHLQVGVADIQFRLFNA
ncbi:MAG: FHA domain-containing protein [Oscillospiraceae bacterium]|nr:FHA domain-containing protein [Oscillospiraceae bacterium]